jgi:hypothetical protein
MEQLLLEQQVSGTRKAAARINPKPDDAKENSRRSRNRRVVGTIAIATKLQQITAAIW